MKKIENIYLAGKIDRNDWRQSIVDLRRLSPQSGDCNTVYGLNEPWPILHNAIEGKYHYTGPYFIGDDHGCFHGEDTHGVGANKESIDNGDTSGHGGDVDMRSWVVERCQTAIQNSDLVFAWIDCIDCYGTIAEIGYARALGKIIWIAGPKRYRDLWFIYELANRVDIGLLPPEQSLHRRLTAYGELHPHFDSPIEQAFWDAWICTCDADYFKLVPQHPIGKYRVDFAHIGTRTAIELDGHATHSSPDAIAYDRQRQRYIESQGWHVIRFGGKEIFANADACVEETGGLLRNRPIYKPVQKQSQYKAGDKIHHDLFGDGVVIKSEMDFNTEFVEVQFQDDRKRLSLEFAKIEVLPE